MKIRSLSELQDALDEESAWRVKEITELKIAVRTANGIGQKTVIRAGIALAYAHWEGFIKNSAQHYLTYINGLRLTINDLADPITALSLKKSINATVISGKFNQSIGIVKAIRENSTARVAFSLSSSIDTKSNLNSDAFSDIVNYLCIDTSKYESKFNFIDESLLSRRNKIAHGEYLDVNGDQWKRIADEVLNLIYLFKKDLEHCASNGSFRRPTTAP